MDIKEILRLHSDWLCGKPGGKKADLSDSNLRDSDLSGSNLRGSNLRGSDLSYSDLSGSNLRDSNLRGSDLCFSKLRGSDLSDSNLRGSNLRDSDLSGSNLRYSNLRGSDLRGSNLRGSIVNWGSHDLLAHILLSHAVEDVEKRKLAGLILISRDWCWRKFLSLGEPLTEWALSVFRQYETPGNPLPLED